MNDLAAQIKQYYFDNFSSLPPDKQFHFASRLAAWQGDATATQHLKNLRNYMTENGNIRSAFEKILAEPIGNVYGKQVRQPFFDKYPRLFSAHNALFRLRHLQVIYNIDAKKEFLQMIPQQELEALYNALISDKEAFSILSRFAVDFVFLYEILFDKRPRLDPAKILNLIDSFDLSDEVQIHLLIYLFTHAIIADSNFYIRAVPAGRLSIYERMLEKIEEILNSQHGIKLDTKYEFLVASRICDRPTGLFEKYSKEAQGAVSASGTYIIDRLVGADGAGLNTPARAEHRNVLFIMAASAYQPKD